MLLQALFRPCAMVSCTVFCVCVFVLVCVLHCLILFMLALLIMSYTYLHRPK
jgi:hypothetical protein